MTMLQHLLLGQFGTCFNSPNYLIYGLSLGWLFCIWLIWQNRVAQKQSEEKFRQLAENIRDIFFLHSHDFQQIIYLSPICEEIWGYAPEVFYRQPQLWLNLIHPEDREKIEQVLQQINKEEQSVEYRIIRPDGETRWLRSRTFLVRNALGEVYRVAGITEDISDRKQIEERLKESEEMFRSIFDRAAVGMTNVSMEGRLLKVNQKYCDILGYSREELLELNVRDISYPEDLGHVDCTVEKDKNVKFAKERRLIRKDGSLVWVSLSVSALHHPSGEVKYLIGSVTDISDRKQVEQELRESQQLLQLVFDTLPQRVFWKDKNFHFLGCNKLFAQDAGLESPEQIIGKHDFELAWRESAHLYRADDTDIIQNNISIINYEEPQVREDGTTLWLRTSKIPLRNEVGKVIGVFGSYEDITEYKAVEDSLRQQIRHEQLIAAITQQIRQSLNLDEILNTTVNEVQQLLQIDRVLIFRLYPDGTAQVIQEVVVPNYPATLGMTLTEEHFPDECYEFYLQGHPRIIPDVATDNWTNCTTEFMQQCEVKSKIVAPILQQPLQQPQTRESKLQQTEIKNTHLWGLLIVHACSEHRHWQHTEADLLQQIANQLAIAIQQANLYAQVQAELAERELTEAKLRKSKLRLAEAQKLAHLGNWKFDVATGKISWSKETFFVHGFDPSQSEPTFPELLQTIHPDDREFFERTVTQALEKGEDYAIDLQILKPNHSVSYTFVQGQCIKNTQNQVVKLFGTVQDITERKRVEKELQQAKEELELRVQERTSDLVEAIEFLEIEIAERKQAEEALHRSEAQNRALLNAIPDMILRLDCHGTLLDFRGKQEQIITELQLIKGRNIADLSLPPDAIAKVMESTEQALRTGKLQTVEYSLTVPNGIHYYEVRIIASSKDEVVVIARDVSDRKAVEISQLALQREQEISRLQRNFFSMISHEFRTPLGVIQMSAQILEHNNSEWLNQKVLRNLHRIQSSVKYTIGLLDDIMTISKAEASQLEFNPQTVILESFCHNLLDEIQLNTSTQFTTHFHCQDAETVAFIDQKLLRFILSNLLSNAIKYSSQNTHVIFTLLCEQDKAIFKIQDFGIGIPFEHQQHIFEPFYRAPNVENIPGSGLGLTVVKKCVEVHQGKISVCSESGVGSTFTVTIPLNS